MRELSWKPEQSAALSVLDHGACTVRPARILELSGKSVHLAADVSLKFGAAVRLEWDEQLLLGQVLSTEPGGFWMEIHHMLDTAWLNSQKQGW
ncbi:MAG TPA: hypothetical protein VKR61_11015 [Bryobacteraceae bacterium]|nr:hypothetical protein [Bryobacteraceae bacterium]